MKLKQTLMILALLALFACGGKEQNATADKNSQNDTALVAKTTDPGQSAPADTTKAEMDATLPTVIDFSAAWCGPCQKFAPVFHKLAKDYSGKANFKTIDVDQDPATADNMHITMIPTVIILDKDGKELKRFTGTTDEQTIKKSIEEAIK